MNFEGINFPVYRKYKNNKSYFKIINPSLFEEVQVIGTRKFKKTIEAKQLPEMNFVNDLIFNFSEMALEIQKEEYESVSGSL